MEYIFIFFNSKKVTPLEGFTGMAGSGVSQNLSLIVIILVSTNSLNQIKYQLLTYKPSKKTTTNS